MATVEQTLRNLIDSLQYVNDLDPPVSGYAVRAQRIREAEYTLKELKSLDVQHSYSGRAFYLYKNSNVRIPMVDALDEIGMPVFRGEVVHVTYQKTSGL